MTLIFESGNEMGVQADRGISPINEEASSGSGGDSINYAVADPYYGGSFAYNETSADLSPYYYNGVTPIGATKGKSLASTFTSANGGDNINTASSGDGGDDAQFLQNQSPSELEETIIGGRFGVNKSKYYSVTMITPLAPVRGNGMDVEKPSVGYRFGIKAIDQDGDGVKGTLALYVGSGQIIDETEIEGVATVNVPPLGPLFSGENSDESLSFSAQFTPGEGIPYTEQNINLREIIEVTYKPFEGQVTDVNGQPVADDPVAFPGKTLRSDENGQLDALVPVSDTDYEVLTMRGQYNKTFNPTKEDTLDVQYGGINVSVTNPGNGIGIPGVPVEIGGNQYTTNEQGEVKLTQVAPGTYDVTLFDKYTAPVEIIKEGYKAGLEFGQSIDSRFGVNVTVSSIPVKAIDARSRNPIAQTPVFVEGTGVRSNTGSAGSTEVLHTLNTSEATVVFGRGDRRYRTERTTVDLTVADPEVSIQLQPRTPTVNF